MFVLAKEMEWVWPVKVRYPADGAHRDGEFRARFRLLPSDRAAALAQGDDPLAAMMREAVIELLDLEDDAGQPLSHSPTLLDAVLAIPFMKLGLSQAYMESVMGAPAKN
jgi:hypothetical protein